jgi:hypothetical protein
VTGGIILDLRLSIFDLAGAARVFDLKSQIANR